MTPSELAAAASKPVKPSDASLASLGVTAQQWDAMPAVAKAALVSAAKAVAEAEAKAAAKAAPQNKLSIVVYADCDQAGVIESGEAKGKPKACRIIPGTDKCSHGNTFKGNLGITGLGKFPLTLYAGQWLRFADHFEALKTEAERIVAAGFGTK
jgi:hypothetical protein